MPHRSIANQLPVFIFRWEIQTHRVNISLIPQQRGCVGIKVLSDVTHNSSR